MRVGMLGSGGPGPTCACRAKGAFILQEAAMPGLIAWESFSVIVGSASAALTGLMFVVVTLIAERGRPRSGEATGAFTPPNVVHFCANRLKTGGTHMGCDPLRKNRGGEDSPSSDSASFTLLSRNKL